ncbi:DNA-formamidopyrimidine glycosylase [Patescibacteria group bacterium]|nr:DNA-formamidopyrimidine glycosylase [Patescibacteria group bacterium]
MPELPEVQTIVNGLNKKILNRVVLDVWTDSPKIIKKPKNFKDFQKKLRNKRVLKVWRRAKNIILELSGGCSLLVHQKLTGHLLAGKWELNKGKWSPLAKGPLEERVNLYIHLMFWLDKGIMLALSDLRKFAKVELWDSAELKNSKEFKKLGPEPLDPSFSLRQFKKIISGKKGKIKQVLMDQKIIAGVGNIYSDEILWRSKTHPQKSASLLKESELNLIYRNIKKVLILAIKLKGESISDFRDLQGERGNFDAERKVYKKTGKKCSRCGAIIKRIKIGGRSAHFCPNCQRL